MELTLRVDAERLLSAFQKAPERTRKMVRTQLKMAVRDIRDYAQDNHRYKTRTGKLERQGINTRVEDNVGLLWLDTQKVVYARAIHEGRQPFTIVPRRKKALRWAGANNNFVFAKRVRHPGIKKDPFLYNAAVHELPKINRRWEAAMEKLFNT